MCFDPVVVVLTLATFAFPSCMINTLHSAFIPNIGFWRYFYVTNSKTLRDFLNKQGFLRIVVGFS